MYSLLTVDFFTKVIYISLTTQSQRQINYNIGNEHNI